MTVQTIARYFAKCGFTELACNDIDVDPFLDLVAAVDELRDKDPSQVPDDVTPEAIVSVDDAAMVTQSYASEQEIVDEILQGENLERIQRSLSRMMIMRRRRKTTRRKGNRVQQMSVLQWTQFLISLCSIGERA